ncbi:hypothetical protein PybrP1_000889, partial [[Pythium] brassicae (nom. inval.)]
MRTVVVPIRASTATIEYLESPRLPPMLQRQLREPPARLSPTRTAETDSRAEADAFRVLHPSLDLSDDSGELSKLMLSKWSIDSGEHAFASISLFCEMKFNEAKRMASWVETPNRFFATVCCQLLHNAAFLQLILGELVDAIFLPQSVSSVSDGDPLDNRVPYFVEFKRLKKHNQFLINTVQSRDRSLTMRERLPGKVERLLERTRARADRSTVRTLFRSWTKAIAADKEIRSLKCRVFASVRKTNLSSIFRAWRIESLRRAYQRESVDYQSMLSLTAASLSRKDVLIADAESKVTSMAKIIDSLTSSNAQLMHRIGQLEASLAAGCTDDSAPSDAQKSGGGGGGGGSGASTGWRRDVQFEHIDTLIAQDDERMDRINRMLLETMFGMARMVESCAIQMSKDIQAENLVKAKAEASESRGSTPRANDAEQLRRSMAGGTDTEPLGSDTSTRGSSRSGTSGGASRSRGAVQIKDLADMPIDAFLLHWFRMNLQMSSAIEKASDRTIKNFTSDLSDGRRFSFLLHRLFPTWFDASMVHEIDTDQRLRNIETFHRRIQPELPQVVTSDSIHAASVTENVSFVAMLFGSS